MKPTPMLRDFTVATTFTTGIAISRTPRDVLDVFALAAIFITMMALLFVHRS